MVLRDRDRERELELARDDTRRPRAADTLRHLALVRPRREPGERDLERLTFLIADELRDLIAIASHSITQHIYRQPNGYRWKLGVWHHGNSPYVS